MVRAKALRGTLQSVTSGYLGVIGLYKNDFFSPYIQNFYKVYRIFKSTYKQEKKW